MKCTTFTVKIETTSSKKKGTSSKKKGNPGEENFISTFCTKNIVSTGTKQQLKSCHTSGILLVFKKRNALCTSVV